MARKSRSVLDLSRQRPAAPAYSPDSLVRLALPMRIANVAILSRLDGPLPMPLRK